MNDSPITSKYYINNLDFGSIQSEAWVESRSNKKYADMKGIQDIYQTYNQQKLNDLH